MVTTSKVILSSSPTSSSWRRFFDRHDHLEPSRRPGSRVQERRQFPRQQPDDLLCPKSYFHDDVDEEGLHHRVFQGLLSVMPQGCPAFSVGGLTRMGEARDWGTGLPLKANLLGRMNKLEVHHIYPKSRLYKSKYRKSEVNALANFCFLTKETNLDISNRLPEDYFPEIEAAHPGALASQWIPDDSSLWKIDRYRDFLEARKVLLAEELNKRMAELLHGDTRWMTGEPVQVAVASTVEVPVMTPEEEEEALLSVNEWMDSLGLPQGRLSYTLVDEETGVEGAVLDLAWPNGIQEELSQPVALLINEGAEVFAAANRAGFRCFPTPDDFRRHVERDILGEVAVGPG
jgi:hypothetical protein